MGKNDATRGPSISRISLGAIGLLCAGLAPAPEDARAQDPATAPVFTRPLDVTNRLLPFVPGAVKVYSGREEGAVVTVVETHLRTTREFLWNETLVPCRVIESLTFKAGAPAGREQVFVAQSDDGAVWTFGEVEDDDPDDDDGDDANEPDGWIVGRASATDPADLVTGAAPAVMMPADPRPGDVWRPEDAPPSYSKTSRAESARAAVTTGAGRHADCLRVREVDEGDGTVELRWFAPELGVVECRERGARLVLRASTIRRGR